MLAGYAQSNSDSFLLAIEVNPVTLPDAIIQRVP